MSDIVHWLRKLAALVEADHAPQHVVMHMRAGADEIERLRGRLEIDPSHPYDGIYARDETIRGLEKEIARLRAGGCARDQGTTQYCAEAAKLAAENERLLAALKDARVSVEGWADYASDYIKEKWDLKGDLARIDAALEGRT